ncbi:MAG: PAS domain-containing protein, partial [Nitrospina sp.]|nr:PAS domain-containing protein [Nitrospina sp.]
MHALAQQPKKNNFSFLGTIFNGKTDTAEMQAKLDAINKSQGVIEFNMDGTVITANDNFLKVLGYTLEEAVGVHHKNFCEESYARSNEYRQFWEKLNRGEFNEGEYKRIGKGGKEVYIQASYNPIFDPNGRPFKVVKFATDITDQSLENAEYRGKIDAISKSQGVIEFNMDGTVITANENFLNVLGYTLDEAIGVHHREFCEKSYAQSNEYRQFWEKLNRGEFNEGEYKRIGKGGKEVYIQATYNPIFDPNGKPFKVVKFATDITGQSLENADYKGKIDAISKSQGVIEFNMDGTVITANENFLNVLGYTLDEAIG